MADSVGGARLGQTGPRLNLSTKNSEEPVAIIGRKRRNGEMLLLMVSNKIRQMGLVFFFFFFYQSIKAYPGFLFEDVGTSSPVVFQSCSILPHLHLR